MATFLSSPAAAGSGASSGERRFAERLSALLEDDYLCWYDVPVGARNQHPDFLILHPGRGLLVLEVKDWKLGNIQYIDRQSVSLLLDTGLKTKLNPLEQARHCAHAVANVLQRDPLLLNPPGSKYEGGLRFPWGYGVVLSNITRKEFDRENLGEVLPAHRVICRDEMTESADAEEFQERLWGMFTVQFNSKLTLPEVDRIRWLLFPEIRIHQHLLPIEPPSDTAAPSPGDLLQVMDLAQEEIARNLGEGHRVVHGVAGSGKTLILAYRCLYLARTLQKRILVLVFNRSLAAWLRHQFASQGLTADRVTVRTFHGWCSDQLNLYHVERPLQSPNYSEELVQTMIRAVDIGQIPRAQYGAVLIDEGHDFAPGWLKLAVQMLDPVSNHLLLLYDDAQSIYGNNRSRSFSFRSVGIAAAGRTRILKRNYRNTQEILACASDFARELLNPVDADEDGVPLIHPEAGGRTGPRPCFAQFATMKQEAERVALGLKVQHSAGVPWNEMAVFYTTPFVAEEVVKALDAAGVPFDWLKDAASRSFDPSHPSVKLMTPHSSKGLQYRVAVIAGVGWWPYRSEVEEARLLYVAMTRATHDLLITSSRPSVFTERLKELCEPLAA